MVRQYRNVPRPANEYGWLCLLSTAAALHYHLVSLTILATYAGPSQMADLLLMSGGRVASKQSLLEQYALDICGIAFTTNSPPVLVNAFGPMAYCKCL